MNFLRTLKTRLRHIFRRSDDTVVAIPKRIIEHKGHVLLLLDRVKPGGAPITLQTVNGYDFSPVQRPLPLYLINMPCAAVVTDWKAPRDTLMYYGDRDIHVATSTDGHHWKSDSTPLPLRRSAFPMQVGGAFLFSHSIVLLYYETHIDHGVRVYEAFVAGFDREEPTKLLWKLDAPLWQSGQEWPGKKVVALGAVRVGRNIMSYWHVDGALTYAVIMSGAHLSPDQIKMNTVSLAKHMDNPIISPRDERDWQAFTTFNPAACIIDDSVHILYRAQGFDYLSTVGYAVSRDGYTIDERSELPVYAPSQHFETNDTGDADKTLWSGGGYGGCEDPRITVLEDRVYMVYVAFDGWSPPRLAMTSIQIADFLARRWNWTKPVLISPPGIIDKSGCILSEKINGKYVMFHRVFPNILIDFVDDLNFDGETRFLTGQHSIDIRPDKWDSRKIGVGAPPVKTDRGWLLIYYGVDDRDDSKYHIGAMLLDLADPTKVLHRSDSPILQPEEEYEMNGFKPGIAYPCGAVIMNDQLMVYYGAADQHVCVATAPLNEFLDQLERQESATLTPLSIHEITLNVSDPQSP